MNLSEHILIIAPNWIGDMVMTQSLFKLVKNHHHDATIDVVCSQRTYPLLQRMPEVDEGILLPVKQGRFALHRRWSLGRRLKERRYDQAIILPRSFKSAIVPWVARAKRRTGFLGEARWGLLNDIRNGWDKTPRTIDRFLLLGLDPGQACPKEFEAPSLMTDREKAYKTLARLQESVPEAPVLALCPGATFGPSKRWPAEHFAAVANKKIEEGWRVWLLASSEEWAITGEIQNLTRDRCLDLAGKIDLLEALDLLALANLVLTNDSGLMHLAASLNRPLIALFGSSDPQRTPPLNPNAKIVSLDLECSPCFKRHCPLGHWKCMKDLTPGRVLEAMEQCESSKL